ncbi:UPF0175 family protein, partial [Acetomicrobium sp. S15 = DSM 107314]|uniref:UPF0175 family protein n=1 Tax=Acetomicrobium sp. S15 = DSM 107314 TaxID=2529858 RepID=UPI0018E10D6D
MNKSRDRVLRISRLSVIIIVCAVGNLFIVFLSTKKDKSLVIDIKEAQQTESTDFRNLMKVLEIPEVNLEDEEFKLALAIKLLEEGKISLGKSAEIAGFSERSFAEL